MTEASVLVLDFGGVITKTLFETHDLSERALGLSPGTLTWRGPFAPESDELWMRMQEGEISERDYWTVRARETGDIAGRNWTTMQQFVIAARGADADAIIRPEFIDALKKVKAAGKRCAILSNELDLFYGKKFRSNLSFLDSVELVIDATYTGILKPDPRAYLLVSDGLNVRPQDCVFVDDQKRNIEGAQAIEMRTVHFDIRNPQAGYDDALAQLGLNHSDQF